MTEQEPNQTPQDEPEGVTTEVVSTPTGNPDNAAEGTGAVSAPEPNGKVGGDGKKEELSDYKKRLQALGKEGVGAEIPLELADMMRAAAKKHGDIAMTAAIRIAFANYVNAAELTHEVEITKVEELQQPEFAGHRVGDKVMVPWIFDLKRLEETKARTSTKNLTPEQKKEKAEQAKAEAVDQRALVKRLLAEHRAKVLGQAS